IPWRSSSSRRKRGLAADFMSDMLTDFWSNVTRRPLPATHSNVSGKTEIFEETRHVHHSLRRPRRHDLVRRRSDALARREDPCPQPCAALCELRLRGREGLRGQGFQAARALAAP